MIFGDEMRAAVSHLPEAEQDLCLCEMALVGAFLHLVSVAGWCQAVAQLHVLPEVMAEKLGVPGNEAVH